MIRVFIGNIGSGKSLSAVMEMYKSQRRYFSNIETKGLKNNTLINRGMILKEDEIGKKRDGTPILKPRLNTEFWQDNKSLYGTNIVIDEAHTIMNSRESMSKKNIIATQFLALLRRVVSGEKYGSGSLTLITQLDHRVDVIARDMTNQVLYHIMYFRKICQECGAYWNENSDSPEPVWDCPRCNSMKIIKTNHIIKVYAFRSIEMFQLWKYRGMKTFYSFYYLQHVEKFFPLYNTYQWGDLFTI